MILLGIVFFITDRKETVFENDYQVTAAAFAEEGEVFFGGPFKLCAKENIEIQASSPATNFWLGIDGDLVDEKNGLLQGFSLPVEYYAGVEEGEAWSEGSQDSAIYLSALPEGEYSLRLEVHGDPKNPPLQLHVPHSPERAAGGALAPGALGGVGDTAGGRRIPNLFRVAPLARQ